jgi:hypothetical protein
MNTRKKKEVGVERESKKRRKREGRGIRINGVGSTRRNKKH